MTLKDVKEFLVELAVSAAIVAFIYFFVAVFPLVPTSSMSPTIATGERIVVEKFSKYYRDFEYGDILVFPCPDQPPSVAPYVKRLIGKGGDVLEFSSGLVYRNGELLNESYAVGTTVSYTQKYEIPPGYLFFMGDNREHSEDARFWHTTSFVREADVIGRAVAVLWPLGHIRSLR
ncbi:MAG: signal peptidase I [Negativicutes bacterium]|nr:signal peptidase I [Negativicutes bacterium]